MICARSNERDHAGVDADAQNEHTEAAAEEFGTRARRGARRGQATSAKVLHPRPRSGCAGVACDAAICRDSH